MNRHRTFAARLPLVILVLAGLLTAGLLLACSQEQEEEELSGAIGVGAGGTAVMAGTVLTDPILTPAGVQAGTLDYDSGYWTRTFLDGAGGGPLYSYENAADGLLIAVFLISGRPDTRCRFDAALLARDEGFTILASGDVLNEAGLEFHQVNLSNGSLAQRFFCAELLNNVGVEITVTALPADSVTFEQVHFLLNTVRK